MKCMICGEETNCSCNFCITCVNKDLKKLEPVADVCTWVYDPEINAYIDTCGDSCALAFTSIEIDSWKYCPYCGKSIKIKE